MLLQPVPLVALLVLVVNDHWLKFAGVLPGWLTGKLSDFAGLIVAPLVIVEACQLLRVRGSLMRQTAIACAVIGLGFALVKTTEPMNALYVAISRALLSPLSWRVAALTDPTDIIALAALAAPLFIARRVRSATTPRRDHPHR